MVSNEVPDPANHTNAGADAVMRQLARRAIGLSGADIERLVREARQSARREQRQLCYADLDRLVSSSRPAFPPQKRRRIAVHEAGHVLVRILLDVGTLSVVTIDGKDGDGFTEATLPDDVIDTVERCEHYLQVQMAGRAAEQVTCGSALSGSGGSARSDLAKATQLAAAMETSLGFGGRHPLVYHDPDHWQSMIRQDARLARRVSARLERAEKFARKLVRHNRERLDMIADELVARGTLEGAELTALVERVRTGGISS
jgi:cell division protease FtsH